MEIFKDKDILVIGNSTKVAEIDRNKDYLVCAFNYGVEKYKPNVAFFNVADEFVKFMKKDIFSIQTSPKERPSHFADYAIPLNTINELKQHVGDRPSSGCIALYYISKLNTKSVTIIGFDFKENPTFYQENREHEPHDYDKEKTFINLLCTNNETWSII